MRLSVVRFFPPAAVALLLLAVASAGSSTSARGGDRTHFHAAPRPTPAPTSTEITRPPALVDDAQLARTEVHVLEKCCPYASRFAVRAYPSALEDDGWMPGLTFHAYKYQRWLPNCWQIVNATADGESQCWHRIPGTRATSADADNALPSPRDSFCLPSKNPLPDANVSVFYVERADKRASFVSQPIRNVSQIFFDSFTLGGWNASSPTFRRVFPLAYYYWREVQPMPRRLITDVRLHAAEHDAPLQCRHDYEIVSGNFNHNFVGDPVAYFCVRYGYSAFVDPRFNLSEQTSQNAFLTDIMIKAKTPFSIRNESAHVDFNLALTDGLDAAIPSSNAPIGDCGAPFEPIASQHDFWTRRNGGSERNAKLDALTATFAQLNATADYSVFTGNSEWLVFCMEKQALVDASTGRYRPSEAFVDRLYLNLSQIVRRQRLGVVYNAAEDPVAPKQSPRGRIYYDIEDAKDRAAAMMNAFDEL